MKSENNLKTENKTEVERRFLDTKTSEIRVEKTDTDKTVIRGYFAKFSTPSTGLNFTEIIEPGFFREALKNSDVVDLLNHDPNYIFGRQSASTENGKLTVYEDEIGLAYELIPLDTQMARDMLIEPIKAGLIKGCSFGFRIKENGDELRYDEKTDTVFRTLKRDGCSELFDGSQVVYPAYDFSGGINVSKRTSSIIDELRKPDTTNIDYERWLIEQWKKGL